MLTQRYALYIILLGVTLMLIAVGGTVSVGFSLLLALVGFYGLLSAFAGYWMWERGKRSV